MILDNYPLFRQFAIEADIPYITFMTLLSRDVDGESFDVITKICKQLVLNRRNFVMHKNKDSSD